MALDKERITREEEMKDLHVSMVNVSPVKTDTSDEIFDKMDKNGDGVVSREEFTTFNEKNDTKSENDEVNSETDEVKSETDEVKETDEDETDEDETDEKPIVVDEDKPKFHGKS